MGKDIRGKELGKGLRQNKDGKYEARYIDRFGKRKSVYATSKAEVKKKLNEALKENAEKHNVKVRLTVNKWYTQWMETYKKPVLRPNSQVHYEHIFKAHILPQIGDMFVEEVRQIHVQSLINRLDREGYQWETQNKVRILIMDMFNYAIENDYALRNPTKGVRLQKHKPNERIVLSVQEQKDFFICANGTFYYNLFLVAVNSGLRPGELCALTEKDIDFNMHFISVNKTLIYQKLNGDTEKTFHIGPPKTDSSFRKVPMNSVCERALHDQMKLKRLLDMKYPRQEMGDLLFVTKFNTPICAQIFNDAIKRIVAEINLQRDDTEKFPEFSAHSFRHTFATRCLEAGLQPKAIQKFLGHATLQMTMDLYVHVSDDFMHSELKKLSNLYNNEYSEKIISINEVKVG